MGVFRGSRGYYSHRTATRAQSAGSVSASHESNNSEPEDEVLVSEEELEEVDESASRS